jgi:hydroxymethylpyrimidine pyrophosphatase-like HAD family hydrolase
MRTPTLEHARQIVEQLNVSFGGQLVVVPMIAQGDDYGYIEIAPSDTGKALAVSRIISKEGMSEFEVVVVGDAYNDVEMIEKYQGYAVNGAVPEAKAVATRTVPSVADLIEELIATEQ